MHCRRLLSSTASNTGFSPGTVAASIVSARLSRQRLASFALIPSISQAYETLTAAESLLNERDGWSTAGYKVGATSTLVQSRLDLSEPFWGPIFQPALLQPSSSHNEATRFSISEHLIRGVEAEFAFVIGRDIVPRRDPYAPAELVEKYCTLVCPSVEVCASRLPVGAPLSGALTILDLAGNEAVLLDKSKTWPLDAAALALEKTRIKVDGHVVAHGSGAQVLGSPATALQWLVNKLVLGAGKTIRAGAVVTTGATCGLVPITKPCYVAVEFGVDEHTSLPARSVVHLCFRR